MVHLTTLPLLLAVFLLTCCDGLFGLDEPPVFFSALMVILGNFSSMQVLMKE